MKRTIFFILSLFLLFLTACDNFMNGSDIQEQLSQMIDIANAKSFTLVISNDTTMGSFLSSGDKECKLGYSIEVQYTVKKDQYIFKGLKAVSKSDLETPLDEYVEFTSLDSDDTRGVYKVSIKLVNESNDILIVPDCVPVPAIIEMTPEYNYEGSQQDTTICLKFNKPVTSVGEIEFLKTAITITDSAGQSLSQYYDTPYFSADSKILYIPTVKTQRLLNNADERMDIVVKFDLSGIKDEFQNVGNGFYQNKYRVNGTLDSIKPKLSAVTVYSNTDKSKQLLATPLADWPASNADNTIYIANHVGGSIYAELEGSDIGSGVARAHVSEKFLKYSDGSTPTTIQTLTSVVEFIGQTEDGKYRLVYNMKNAMDGIIELKFSLEDFAGNVSKPEETKTVNVLKDTLVESTLIHFDQELSQMEVTEQNWLAAMPIVEGDTQNVNLTITTTSKDTFYANCTSDFVIEGFWGYSKDAITNPIRFNKQTGEFTFTRDVTKFVYIKLNVSDDIGNTSEIIRYMDPRPEFNSVSDEELMMSAELSLKGLDSVKLLANKSIGMSKGDPVEKTYTQFIAYIYDEVDEQGNPVGDPERKMYFPTYTDLATGTPQIYPYGSDLYAWRNTQNFTGGNSTTLNKLFRIYGASICGDFISPMTTDYVEYMIASINTESGKEGEYIYAENKAPKLSSASASESYSSIYYQDVHYEYGPYIKDSIKITTKEIKNSGMYKFTIEDYKTAAAIAEGNVQYHFIAEQRAPTFYDPDNPPQEITDETCYSSMEYVNKTPEFYLPAMNYYKFFIVATGRQGTYVSVNTEEEYPYIGNETGINFYLNDASTPINFLGFTEDITPPIVPYNELYYDPFSGGNESGSIKIIIAEDESGLYKNKKGNYELTYYLIPATGTSLQTTTTYTLEELERNFTRYKRTIEYSIPNTPEGQRPDIMDLSLPMGNEKGGVYNVVVVYEDIHHNATVTTYRAVNRLLGPLDFSQYQTSWEESSENGNTGNTGNNIDIMSPYQDPVTGDTITPYIDSETGVIINPNPYATTNPSPSSQTYSCQHIVFTLGQQDYVKIYQASENISMWNQIWASNDNYYNSDPENGNIYKAWNQTSHSEITNQWLKICGYKKSNSAFETGFYNTEYYYLTNQYYIQCKSKNALPGLNGIQIFFDNPILVHTMFFKDYIPDDIDKDNYNDWERRGAETGVMTAKPKTQTVEQYNYDGTSAGTAPENIPSSATYSFKSNYKGIPSGCYYRTIIHFADGDVIMTDIGYKE